MHSDYRIVIQKKPGIYFHEGFDNEKDAVARGEFLSDLIKKKGWVDVKAEAYDRTFNDYCIIKRWNGKTPTSIKFIKSLEVLI